MWLGLFKTSLPRHCVAVELKALFCLYAPSACPHHPRYIMSRNKRNKEQKYRLPSKFKYMFRCDVHMEDLSCFVFVLGFFFFPAHATRPYMS